MDSTRPAGGILVVWNPNACAGRSGRRLDELKRALSAHAAGETWFIEPTRCAGGAADLAEAAGREGAQIIAAAGGDGTCGEVLNGLMRLPQPRPALAVLPMGTGNDFAGTLGLHGLGHAAETMFHGRRRRVDAGCVNGRWFINAAGCGFDAVVSDRVRLRPQPLRGKWAYIFAAAASLPSFRGIDAVIVTESERIETRCMLTTVANARSYGGGMQIAPDTKLDDGRLDICILGEIGRLAFLRAFPSVFRGRHVTHPKVRMLRAETVFVSMEPAAPLLVDGDVFGATPAQFTVAPAAYELLVPIAATETRGWKSVYSIP